MQKSNFGVILGKTQGVPRVVAFLAAATALLFICQVSNVTTAQADERSPEVLIKLAEQGDAQAQFDIGVKFYYGQGVSQDRQAAFAWFRKAAEQGHAAAQYALGRMYYYGQGVKQSGQDALQWFRKAAEKGSADAQFSLGVMYQFGKGVEKDVKQAEKWYRSAAESGLAAAQYALGAMYRLGQGAVKDTEEGYRWLKKAADQQYKPAVQTLTIIQAGGPDVEVKIQDIQNSLPDTF